MTTAAPVTSDLRRGRLAVYLLFLLAGGAIGTWTARIPAIKAELGLTDGRLSLALLGLAAGAITGMQVVARLVDRYGSAKVMTTAAFLEAVVLILPAYAPGLVTLALTLYAFGVVHGTLNIAMNANAVEVERRLDRPVMSSFHAAYSVGGIVGALVGGLFAWADLSAAATFWAVAVAVVLLAWAASRAALSTVSIATDAPKGEGRQPMPGVFMLGVLAFCCLVGEGAAADWSTVYLRDSLGSSPGFAALAYASFSVMMTAGRLAGDGLTARFGPVALVRGSGILAAGGLGIALLIGHPIAGLVGFGCLGAGLSCIAPQAFSAAGRLNPDRAGHAIARVASIGYLGFLTAPAMIGGAATLVGLPTALAIPVLLALLAALSSPSLATHRNGGDGGGPPRRP